MNIILLSLSVVFLIIGVHQSFYFGIQNSYWAFMLSGGFFLWLQIRKRREAGEEERAESAGKSRPASRGKGQSTVGRKRKKRK